MRPRHYIEYYALRFVTAILCLIPLSWAMGLGSLVGSLGWRLGIRKELVLSNIAKARPQATPGELEQIGKAAARNFGRTAAEFIRYGIKDRDKIESLVEIENLTALEKAIDQGNGAIVLTGHFGAWAVYFSAVSFKGIPLSLLVGKQHNEKVDEFILKIPGDRVEFISKGRAAVKKIIAKLNEGRAIVMVADQHAGKNGVVVPFLGVNASTLPLPGSFAVKHGAPVFIMTGYRKPDGEHKVTIKELEIPEQESADLQKIEVVRRYNEELGKIVSERPEQYFWYHRRWREESESSNDVQASVQ